MNNRRENTIQDLMKHDDMTREQAIRFLDSNECDCHENTFIPFAEWDNNKDKYVLSD